MTDTQIRLKQVQDTLNNLGFDDEKKLANIIAVTTSEVVLDGRASGVVTEIVDKE